MKKIRLLLFMLVICAMGYSQNTIRLDQINLANATTGWGTIRVNKSVDNNALKINGTTYTNGVGIHSASEINLKLNGTATRFQATVGLDDEVAPSSGNIEFQVYADNALLWTSGVMKNTDAVRTQAVDVDITGKKYLSLITTIGSDGSNAYDHADWVNTQITYSGTAPTCVTKSSIPKPPVIAYKTYFMEENKPADIRFEIKSTSPVTYTVTDLPAGLTFDSSQKSLSGTIQTPGVYSCKLKVENEQGADSALVAIDVLENTSTRAPLMGWASWNNFHLSISESVIKGQADAMVSSGLADAGYNYINIDDGFFNQRYPDGSLRLDSIKFPNGMKVVADYIHSKGLKAGFYSEAGANTCGSIWDAQQGGIGGGMYQHEQEDADLFFKNWGFDFLKVDYCGGLNQGLDERARYSDIKAAIDRTGRKGVNFNVCRWQFPGTWVTQFADSWRISQDITNSWSSMISIIDKNTFLAPYASRGHYNDMDMLEVGRGMTADEDKSQFSMWCILSAPLVLGNDLSNLSQQTKEILTNREAIAVNQDTTGVQGRLISDNGAGLQVWAKNLNGKLSKERAVVLFNRSTAKATMSIKWKELNLTGPATVRDLWSHTDLGSIDSIYTVSVPSHCVVMLKIVGTQAKLQEVFEAEYAWINNYNLTKNAAVVADQGRVTIDATCSGRAKATWIGNNTDNWIEFRDVFANQTREYTLSISVVCSTNRNMTVSVNGKDTELTNLNTGGAINVVKIPVTLNQGNNSIRISNATGWLPDVDKIALDLNENQSTQIKTVKTPIISIYPNPAKDLITIEASELPKKAQLSISNAMGQIMEQLPFTQDKQTISLKRFADGVYIINITNSGSSIYQSKFIVCKK